MKLGFDARVIEWPGLGTYSRNLLQNFANLQGLEVICFCNSKTRNLIPEADNFDLAVLDEDIFSVFNHKKVGKIVNKKGCELFHSPHVIAPAGLDCPLLVTAHDIIPILNPKSVTLRRRHTSRWLLKDAIRRADHIITASYASLRYLEENFKNKGGKISVISDGVNQTQFFPRGDDVTTTVLTKYNIKAPHLLWLGSCLPHKNIAALIDAFAMLKNEKFSQYNLTLAGKQMGRHWQTILDKIDSLGLSEKINLPGFIEDVDLPGLFSSATLFCFPSLYEGFGLPPIEAMACGTPVLCSNRSSLPEVVGSAGILADPDASSLNREMKKFLEDSRAKKILSEKGIKRASEFTWEKTAQKTLAVYQKIIN